MKLIQGGVNRVSYNHDTLFTPPGINFILQFVQYTTSCYIFKLNIYTMDICPLQH